MLRMGIRYLLPNLTLPDLPDIDSNQSLDCYLAQITTEINTTLRNNRNDE